MISLNMETICLDFMFNQELTTTFYYLKFQMQMSFKIPFMITNKKQHHNTSLFDFYLKKLIKNFQK